MTNQEIKELAGHREVPPWVMKLVADAVAVEREACAKVCESHKSENFPLIHNNAVVGCAFAIRARGEA